MLADPPRAAPEKQAPGAPPEGDAPQAQPNGAAAPPRTCARCGAAMGNDQDWCLECGAGAPDSLSQHRSWRAPAAVIGALAILIAGAGAAAYAAWSGGSSKRGAAALAQAGAPAAASALPSASAGAPPAGVIPPRKPPTLNLKPGAAGALPGLKIRPPKIPLTAITPKAAPLLGASTGSSTTAPSSSKGTSSKGTSSNGTGSNGTSTGSSPSTESSGATAEGATPILLDTNAAATYNPYSYPAERFGDPRRAIDGDSSTAWTAAVDPAVAPRMAEGLVIDLKSARKLGSLTVITSTPGMTAQVYGAKGSTLPTTITDPSWVRLSPAMTIGKKRTSLALRESAKAFRFMLLWISRAAPARGGAIGTPPPASVNELELFPAK
jgi:hypothetical protein